MLLASIIMGCSYATEWFMAWYGGEHAERSLRRLHVHRRLRAAVLGACSPATCVIPQAFWFAARAAQHRRGRSPSRSLINIGMWLERILIVWNTLSHGYLPSMWRLFFPTLWDWLLLAGSLGFFALLFLIFVPRCCRRCRCTRCAKPAASRRTRHERPAARRIPRSRRAAGRGRRARAARHRALDAFTPFPVEGLDEALGVAASAVRTAMLVGGLAVAALRFRRCNGTAP